MNLKFKKPSKETQKAMSEVAGGKNRDIDYQKIAQEKLAGMTNHKFSKLLSSGNAAIFTAMNAIDGAIMIPDQGAWNGFKQIARFLNKDLIVVKTDKGLITKEYLSEILNSSSNIGALFLTSFAAYTAEQDISGISDFLHEKDIMLVEDASGAIGDDILADGKYSDIIIGSTGSPKIVNVEDGGFITTNNEEVLEKSRLLLKSFKTGSITACGISSELDFANENLKKSIEATRYVKNNLSDEFDVFHLDKRGINVILKTDDAKKLSYDLRHELVLDSHGMITKCPNYNRLKEKAVAIEIKNLDISCLNKDNLNEIIEIIKKYQ